MTEEPAADLLATVLGFGARVLLSDGFQVHDPAPKPAEVRSQAAAGFTGGDLVDLGGRIGTVCLLSPAHSHLSITFPKKKGISSEESSEEILNPSESARI